MGDLTGSFLKTVFLTGGSGFVGSHTARLFLEKGWAVRALLRRPSRPGLLPAGVEVVPAALDCPDSYRHALSGCDAVVHVAGVVKARTLAEYRLANVVGTRLLAEAAWAVCPQAMFVHVSSQAAAGPALAGKPVCEHDRPHPVSWYGRSKLEGEQALAACYRGPWCIVRPSVVYGPGDPGLLQMFSVVAKGIAPILAGGRQRVQVLAADDLARILLALACRPDLARRTFFAAGPTVTTGQLAREVGCLRTPPARPVPVPGWVVWLAGMVESVRETVTGQTLPFNRDKAREMLQPDWTCDGQPLLRELQVTDLEPWQQGLARTCRWYVAHGWLPGCFAGV
jgi:nucleoside-diphosphate-sugar epimerase